jgi:hypothetical protein
MGQVINFPDKHKSDPELQKIDLAFDEADEWFKAIKAMEERFGGVSLSDLEDEDVETMKIANRALTKEWLQLHTEDINRK